MKKKLVATILTGLLLAFTACGSQESPVIPKVTGTAIENTQESVLENAETETASQQEMQTETATTGKVEITTEDFEGSSDPENAERKYTYTYQVPTITIEGNEEAQEKIQKDLNAYVETFLDSINNSDFGTVYEGEMSGVTSYEELSFQVIRADDKVISVVWGNEGYNQGADIAGTGNGPASPTFSITGDGFVFESGQYVLQPYAVGIVDFEIPAEDFGGALTADIF